MASGWNSTLTSVLQGSRFTNCTTIQVAFPSFKSNLNQKWWLLDRKIRKHNYNDIQELILNITLLFCCKLRFSTSECFSRTFRFWHVKIAITKIFFYILLAILMFYLLLLTKRNNLPIMIQLILLLTMLMVIFLLICTDFL